VHPGVEPLGAGGGADRRSRGRRLGGPRYRGPDRRRLSTVTPSEDRFFRGAVLIVAGMGAAATIAGFWHFSAGSDMAQRLDTTLDHVSAVLGAVAAVVLLLGCRLRGQTRPAALALAVLLLFAVHPVLSHLALAVSFLTRGPQRSVAVDRWFGVALGTWGWAGLVSSAGEGSARATLSDAVLHLLGMAFLVCGVLVEMVARLRRERDAFFDAQVGGAGRDGPGAGPAARGARP
jgi:hypothetical protein